MVSSLLEAARTFLFERERLTELYYPRIEVMAQMPVGQPVLETESERARERQTETERQRERKTERERETKTGGKTERQRQRQTERGKGGYWVP